MNNNEYQMNKSQKVLDMPSVAQLDNQFRFLTPELFL